MATSDYGATYTFNSSSIGELLNVDYPEVATDAVETTNHGSGGVREYIPSGLLGVGQFTLLILAASGTLGTLDTAIDNKTVANSVIANGVDTLTFSSFIVSYQLESADAQSPDADRITVVVQPTGAITLS
jgi:hypothetical protein